MTEKIKYASRSSGDSYLCLMDWPEDCSVQCGGHGLVLPKGSLETVLSSNRPMVDLAIASADKKSYRTAFFEAFPKIPNCFIRGEGPTIEEAEEKAFNELKKIIECTGHEFEPRGRKDGYGYCKKCPLSLSDVLPILNKCCKCKTPTNWTTDYKGRFYCKKHGRTKPKSKKPSIFDEDREKIPRKLKKWMKRAFKLMLKSHKNIDAKTIKMRDAFYPRLIADSKWQLDLSFNKQALYKFMQIKRKR